MRPILEENSLKFNEKHFVQTHGIAMGNKMAWSLSPLFSWWTWKNDCLRLAHWNPLFGRGLSFLCGRFQWRKFPFLLTSLTRPTLRSILLVKCHPNTLFFSIQMYSKDLAFQLLGFSIHKPISSPLKLFSIHTSYPVNHSLRKSVLSKEKQYVF